MEEKTKKVQKGFVVSEKMDKSVVVLVERLIPHKLYGKFIKQKVKYMAHDASNQCKVGDFVLIEECRPLSKRKRWLIKSILESAV